MSIVHFDDLSKSGNYTFFPVVKTASSREIVLENVQKLVNFGSCDYLGLSNDDRLKTAAQNAISCLGTNISGAMLMSGYTYLHRNFESALASMFEGYHALMFTTSFLANLGAIPMIVGHKDVIIMDKLSHSCLIQGALLSKAKIRVYKHNDMEDLEQILREYENTDTKKVVLTDGVFSADGDLANLASLVSLCERYNAISYVDDAHGVGILGDNGCGLAEHCGVLGRVDFISGTMSKSFGSTGGFLLIKDQSTYNLIRHTCHCYTGSRAVSPGVVAASLESLEINKTEGVMRRKKAASLAGLMISELTKNKFNILHTETPIVPIVFGGVATTGRIAKELMDKGFLASHFLPPFVEHNKARLRVGVTYNHTEEDVISFIHCLSGIAKNIAQGA